MITVNQTQLSKKLSPIMKVVPSRPTLPILSYIKLSVKDNLMTLAGTDLDSCVIQYLTIQGDDEFECCVPGRFFTDLVNTMDETITLSFDNNLLHLDDSDEIKTMETLEFPALLELPEQKAEMESSELAYIIERVIYAAATDENRPSLTGVLLEFGDSVKASSADGFRLAIIDYNYQVELPNVIIPSKFLTNLMPALKEKDVQVEIYTTDNQVFFKFPDSLFISQLIEGQYPQVSAMIPKDNKVSITLKTRPFLKAVKRLLVYAKSESDVIMMEYQENGIRLYAFSKESGNGDVTLDGDVTGEQYKTAFNGQFIKDILVTMPKDIVLEQNGENTHIVIYPVGEKDKHITILAPMAVRDN